MVSTLIKTAVGRSKKSNPTTLGKALEQQIITLREILNQAERTEIGVVFDFEEIIKSPNVINDFKYAMPVYTYESFYKTWLKHALKDAEDVIWPGKIKYYALTSGTTADTSKKIPVSSTMIKKIQETALDQIDSLNQISHTHQFYANSVLLLGGSSRLKKIGRHYEGDLSGILQHKQPFWFRLFSKPGRKIEAIEDWRDKLDEIIKNAPKWNIGAIAGLPSWIHLLIQNVVDYYGLNSIHDIWPNLQLIGHGGVHLEPYQKDLVDNFDSNVYFQNAYMASEGFFAYQKDLCSDGVLNLICDKGVYYEFVEYTPENFENGVLKANIELLNISEIEANKNYVLVITTCSGLYKYIIGDVVKFSDLDELSFRITGRVKNAINLCAEHVTEEETDLAILNTAEKFGIHISEYTITPFVSSGKVVYNWFISSNANENLTGELLASIDNELKMTNDDYKCEREQGILKEISLKILPVECFIDFMQSQNRFGSQTKFPKVLTGEKKKVWETHINHWSLS